MSSKIYELKIDPENFDQLCFNIKVFRIKNDGSIKRDDYLRLREYDEVSNQYTDRDCLRKVRIVIYDPVLLMKEGKVVVEVNNSELKRTPKCIYKRKEEFPKWV